MGIRLIREFLNSNYFLRFNNRNRTHNYELQNTPLPENYVEMKFFTNRSHIVNVEFTRSGITSPVYNVLLTHKGDDYFKGLLTSSLDDPIYRIYLFRNSPYIRVTELSQTHEKGMTFRHETGRFMLKTRN